MAAVAPATDVLFASIEAKAVGEYYSPGLRSRFQLDATRPVAPAEPKHYANIGYEVNEEAFRRRGEARLAAGGLPTAVPSGWPTEVEGPLVWTSDSFPDESAYVYHLTDEDKTEIGEALEYFKKQGLDGNEVQPDVFPLPKLQSKLNAVCNDVYDGRGFAIVRGLEPDDYPVEDLTVVYLGVSSYVAERRGKQDQRGSMLMHVIMKDEQDTQYSEDKPFHTDTVTDCLCLFTQNLAKSGGRSVLSSAWTVYNELAATRPDLIHVLSAPDWPFDTFQRAPVYYTRPVLFHYNTKLILSFSRRLLVGHLPNEIRTPGIPGLTEAQAEAIDAVHFIAAKHEFKPRMERGDLRFINNMAVLHRREAFTNSRDEGGVRHLVRVWLNNQKRCWALPRPLRIAWARIFEDTERGEYWDIEPPRAPNGRILRVSGSCD